MSRAPIKTKIADIVAYWFSRVDECDLSVDAAEAHERCWRCGCERNLQRCHIVPDALDGKDEPANLVLLCKRCHAENPNTTDVEIMWDWIKAYKVPFYDTFWSIRGMQEYRFIYKKSIREELKHLGMDDPESIEKELKQILSEVNQEASVHFGQPYLNTATVAGMYRMALKKLAEKRNLPFPSPSKSAGNVEKQMPWWFDV